MTAHTHARPEPRPQAETSPSPETGTSSSLPARVHDRALRMLQRVDEVQRRRPALAIPFAVVKKFGEDRGSDLAALVSYYAFFSLFPLMLVLTTVTGFVLSSRPDLQAQIVDGAASRFPVLGEAIRSSGTGLHGSVVALVIGVAGALWAGLGALDAMQNALNSVWGVRIKDRPALIRTRLRSLAMLVVLLVAITASTTLSGLTAAAADVPGIGRLLALVPMLVVNVAMFIASFKVLTETDEDWRAFIPGAISAGLAFTILQLVGGWYVQRVIDGAGAVYGTFALVLGLLSWVYLQAQVVTLSAELNVVLRRRLWPRSLVGTDLTAADEHALASYAEQQERIDREDVEVDLP